MEKILILGRGVSGNGAYELAQACRCAAQITTDAEVSDPAAALSGVTTLVVSPGVRADSALLRAAQERGIAIESELEFGFRHYPGKILAVTGTNGKTTTVELTGHLLERLGVAVVAAGNIGLPLSVPAAQILRGERDAATVAAVEVSSFQLEYVQRFAPFAAVLLNVASDHLDRYHGDMAEYHAVKMRIFNQVPPENRLYGCAMPESRDNATRFRIAGTMLEYDGRSVLDLRETALNAPHNRENMLAALELARRVAPEAAADLTGVAAALREFHTGAHRICEVARHHGVRYIDDSKATNPAAVLAALRALAAQPEGNIILLAGGLDKGMDFSVLAAAQPWLRAVLLFGASQAALAGVFPDSERFADLESAVARAAALACAGDTVLLSPACASMDMFKNYQERGDRFAAAARRLA